MSLDVLPDEIALQAVSGQTLTWTGHYAVSAGLFEIRPPRIPRDARPVFDEDLDCIIGYQRSFGGCYHLYDLNGDMTAIWEGCGTRCRWRSANPCWWWAACGRPMCAA